MGVIIRFLWKGARIASTVNKNMPLKRVQSMFMEAAGDVKQISSTAPIVNYTLISEIEHL